mmetsp:Transcript_57177/g.118704  ORF Transcript_57177/g.118704 Transcript_57177/m.118704 type:complete len:229 (-) Transcript_57177:89-775(-)
MLCCTGSSAPDRKLHSHSSCKSRRSLDAGKQNGSPDSSRHVACKTDCTGSSDGPHRAPCSHSSCKSHHSQDVGRQRGSLDSNHRAPCKRDCTGSSDLSHKAPHSHRSCKIVCRCSQLPLCHKTLRSRGSNCHGEYNQSCTDRAVRDRSRCCSRESHSFRCEMASSARASAAGAVAAAVVKWSRSATRSLPRRPSAETCPASRNIRCGSLSNSLRSDHSPGSTGTVHRS